MSNQNQKSWSSAGKQEMDTGGCQNILADNDNQQFSESMFHVARKRWAAKNEKLPAVISMINIDTLLL